MGRDEVTSWQHLNVDDRQLSVVDVVGMDLTRHFFVTDVMDGWQNGLMNDSYFKSANEVEIVCGQALQDSLPA